MIWYICPTVSEHLDYFTDQYFIHFYSRVRSGPVGGTDRRFFRMMGTSVQVSGKIFQNFIWYLGLILKLTDV